MTKCDALSPLDLIKRAKEKYHGIDPYSFINSPEIGDYLRSIEYDLSAQQIAYFIWVNGSMTVKEKHAAWNDLIEKLSDEEIPETLNCMAQKSLHEFLRMQMNLENKIIDIFFGRYRDEDELCCLRSVYSYCVDERGYSSEFDSNGSTTNLRYCLIKAKIDASYLISIGVKQEDIEILLKMQYLLDYDASSSPTHKSDDFNQEDKEKSYSYLPQAYSISLKIDTEGEVQEILRVNLPIDSVEADQDELPFTGIPRITASEWKVMTLGFDGFYYNMPIPFEKGDIVCDCFSRKPFVLANTTPWYRNDHGLEHLDEEGHGDSSDMGASGIDAELLKDVLFRAEYEYDPRYSVYFCNNYLNLIPYKGELKGDDRLLIPYSKSIKGELSPLDMVLACKYVAASDYANEYELWDFC